MKMSICHVIRARRAVKVGGTNDDLVHAGADNSERTKLGSAWFHHTALGLASTTTNGLDTGFIREPTGTLNSMTTGGKSCYYLTNAAGKSFEFRGSGGGIRRKGASMDDAIRRLRIFSAILIAGGMCACMAGAVTGDAVPIALGAIAAVSGVVLAVFAFIGLRKTRS
ncbi:hypothetical protein [Streptomyces canus]|uniref:hypothetical protein n=1 Tax=Streptomyces canus TaxID=58343 RepID=UPI003867C5B7